MDQQMHGSANALNVCLRDSIANVDEVFQCVAVILQERMGNLGDATCT